MLNIPEEIKQLFRQGSVKKKLRIHFPNGEREDITNENLIAESFSFEESICSENTLKFGFCEGSVVEFETFGVGNIKKCEIEVTLEILNEYSWYSIPIGKYVVESCERQADLNRRKVVAYTLDFSMQVKISEFERLKQASYSRVNTPYNYQLIPYLYNNINGLNDEFVTQKTIVENDNEVELYQLNVNEKGPLGALYAKVYFYGKAYNFYYNNEYSYQEMPGVKIPPDKLYNYIVDKKSGIYLSLAEIDSLFKLYDVNFTNHVNGSTYLSFDRDKVKEYLKKPHIYMKQNVKMTNYASVGKEHFFSHIKDAYSVDNEYNFYFYPEINNFENTSKDNAYMYFFIPTRMHVDYYYDGEINFSYDYEMYSGDLFNCEVKDCLNPTRNIKRDSVERFDNISVYRVEKEENLKDLLEPFLELNGKFGSIGRDGNFKIISLNTSMGLYPSETLYPADDLYPIVLLLTKSMYKSAWYDDEYTRLYSKVKCTYKDSTTQEDTYLEYNIVEVEEGKEDNYQTYDISDNYLIKEGLFTKEQIMEILTILASNIEHIKYMPSEIDLLGLPYLEAGDAIQVLTNDGGFETIILRRTLTGIQALSDNFESRG